jgi:hypothetical protein
MNPAVFAKATYKMSGTGDKETRIQAAQDFIDEQGNEENWKIEPRYSNRGVMVFTTDDKVHISHTGTNLGRVKDLEADLSIALNREENNKTFSKRKTQTENALRAFPDKIATASSHSLGGSTLYNAAISNRYIGNRLQKIDTYNQGFSPFSGRVPKSKVQDLKDKLFIHRAAGDLVSASALKNNPKLGNIVTYEPTVSSSIPKRIIARVTGMGFTLQNLNAHSIDNFI